MARDSKVVLLVSSAEGVESALREAGRFLAFRRERLGWDEKIAEVRVQTDLENGMSGLEMVVSVGGVWSLVWIQQGESITAPNCQSRPHPGSNR